MKLISHRGNVNGSCDAENEPHNIQELLDSKIDCEIDVWHTHKKFYLGHDFAQYEVNFAFLQQSGLWCHAKNLEALYVMLSNGIRCFWHENDDFTLTSDGFIWTYMNKPVCEKSIIVDNSSNWKSMNYNCYGICSDYIL
jgi:hypothetical protein